MKLTTTSALAFVLSLAPWAAAHAQHQSEGSWIWVNRAGGHASHQNQSSFKVHADNRTGRYCYNGKCSSITLAVRGNVYTFSTDGKNHFEFESGAPDDMIGRAWVNGANGGPPDAVVRMVTK
jgi:hypothetical protein